MPQPANWFLPWFNSPYYHLLYVDRDDQEAAQFVEHLLEWLKPPPGAFMLDMACGRGRHARILAQKGYDVTGIDIAPQSIAWARQFEQDHLEFFLHDMRRPFRVNYYDYVFNFFTSFGYFDRPREHEQTIENMSGALKSNGILILDFLNVDYAASHWVPYLQKDIQGVHFDIRKKSDAGHFYKTIQVEDPARGVSLVFTERVAKFRLQDFKALFGRHRLHLLQTFGDYSLQPFDIQHSPRLILMARKSS